MIPFNAKAGWMEFPYLTVSAGLTRTYTLAYRVTDNSSEKWTSRFNRFKQKETKAYYGGARLFYAAFPPLLTALNLAAKDCVLISALSSSETKADRKRQIPYITDQLAETVGSHVAIDALSKQVHGRIHNIYKGDLRDAELDKAHYVCSELPAKNVFVFDDFVTRGGTLSRIAQAVKSVNPHARVYGVALAKTERTNYCPNPQNDHVPGDWDTVWTNGEKEVT